MYFLDAPTNPSTLDREQYIKIQDFREKYASRGIYSVIKDKNEFKTQFTNHLTMHFLPLVSGEKSSFEKQQQLAPKLIIQNNFCTFFSMWYIHQKKNNLLIWLIFLCAYYFYLFLMNLSTDL